MQARAVIFEKPGQLTVAPVDLRDPTEGDLVVAARHSGISTGTERLLWQGAMPAFPGMGYPLVPGYETVGEVVDAPAGLKGRIGEQVFVPGSSAYQDVKGLFGGTADTLVVPAEKALSLDGVEGAEGALLALAATAHHALAAGLPDLIVGHGVLGRLLARLTMALGGEAPTVWEANPVRRSDEVYPVINPASDNHNAYGRIIDVSGDSGVVDQLVTHLAPGGEIVLAGFYSQRVNFAFPPAFMKEARLRVAAEWKTDDMAGVRRLLAEQSLSLGGLISHSEAADNAAQAYDTAFNDASCLKMVLNWGARS
ncbi:MAG: chlorophyll synthesis pathway protein BchC [Pseudomonadota bacterium]